MIALGLLGLNHRSAPVELRERLAFADDSLPTALTALQARGSEAYLLSTCNRTELYVIGEANTLRATLVDFLSSTHGVPQGEIESHSYFVTDDDAARNLFRVASGLDSMVLGEDQVLGQVRAAFQAARLAQTIGSVLGRLLPLAIEVGKRARTETNIGRGALSPSSVAVRLAERIIGDLHSRSVLVIGAGDAGKATARSLMQAGVDQLLVTNRSAARVHDLAALTSAVEVPYPNLLEALGGADIAISCTSAAEHIVSASDLQGVMATRPDRPLLCIDIAVPRDFEPEAARIPAVHLYNIDDLEDAAAENRDEREREAAAAEAIVDEGVAEFRRWRETRELDAAIGAVYERADAIRRGEIERTIERLRSVSSQDRELIDLMTSSIVRRLLHEPVAALKAQGKGSNSSDLAQLARELFGVDGHDVNHRVEP